MAINQKRGWLIAYDITLPRRLGRIFRFLKKHAIPVQYSVFYFEGSSNDINNIIKDILKIINPKSDDVRIYPIPLDSSYNTIGKAKLPDGISFFSDLNSEVPGLGKSLKKPISC